MGGDADNFQTLGGLVVVSMSGSVLVFVPIILWLCQCEHNRTCHSFYASSPASKQKFPGRWLCYTNVSGQLCQCVNQLMYLHHPTHQAPARPGLATACGRSWRPHPDEIVQQPPRKPAGGGVTVAVTHPPAAAISLDKQNLITA